MTYYLSSTRAVSLAALAPLLWACSEPTRGTTPLPPIEEVEQTIIDGPPLADRKVAFVLVDIGSGSNLSEEQATALVFGTGSAEPSMKRYYVEASYGRQDIVGGVAGPFSYSMTNCSLSGLEGALKTQVDVELGGQSDHYFWYFGSNNSSCAAGIITAQGSPTAPASYTLLNATSQCIGLLRGPLRNRGAQSSSALRCGPTVIFPNDPSTCTAREGGDPFDVLGTGCYHLNAWQKAYQGWFGGCNSVRVNSSGTFTLLPLELECNGIQVLQIPMPVSSRVIPRSGGNDPVEFYYLELRAPSGFDANLSGAPTVLVHVGPDYVSPPDIGRRTWLLDMSPQSNSSTSFEGMSVGQTFTDPAGGVSFTLDALSATSATISVTVPTNGENSCIGGGTLTAPGPSTCTGGSSGGMGGQGGAGGSSGFAGSAGQGGVAGSAGAAGFAGSTNGGMGALGGAGGTTHGGAAGSGPNGGSGDRPGDGGDGGDAGDAGGESSGGSIAGMGGSTSGTGSTDGGDAGDAGSAGSPSGGISGRAGSSNGGAIAAGSASKPEDEGSGSGCGCRATTEGGSAPWRAVAWILVVGAVLRRRRRS